MKKTYWIIDVVNGDEFEEKFEGTFDEAIAYAYSCFENLTKADKKRREAFFVISDCNGQPAHLVEYSEIPADYAEEYHDVLNHVNSRAYQIAKEIRSQSIWDLDLCKELCEEAGMADEWAECTADDFEKVVYTAAEKLGVEVL